MTGAAGTSERSLPPSFYLMAKPSGAICNLDCAYCYFLSKESLYPGSKFRTSDGTLEAYIRELIQAQAVSEATFAYQGGTHADGD